MVVPAWFLIDHEPATGGGWFLARRQAVQSSGKRQCVHLCHWVRAKSIVARLLSATSGQLTSGLAEGPVNWLSRR